MTFVPSAFQYLLFDLDGTLTDSGEGILRCVRYALQKCGKPNIEDKALQSFIGPPLLDSFQNVCRMSLEEAKYAVSQYRERFARIGMFENSVYEGIPVLLQQLQASGYTLAIATSKPEIFTRKILTHFHLSSYFTVVAGSNIQKEGETKADIIQLVFQRLGLTSDDLAKAVMIGDRKYDIIGAKACGIPCVGVSYGYAPAGELEAYHADRIVSSVTELAALFLEK